MDKYVVIREGCLNFIRTGLLNITDIFILTLKNRFEFILHGQHTKFFPVEWFIPFLCSRPKNSGVSYKKIRLTSVFKRINFAGELTVFRLFQ